MSIRPRVRTCLYRADKRAAYDLARQCGVRRRTVRRILHEARLVQDWADIRHRIAAAGGER